MYVSDIFKKVSIILHACAAKFQHSRHFGKRQIVARIAISFTCQLRLECCGPADRREGPSDTCFTAKYSETGTATWITGTKLVTAFDSHFLKYRLQNCKIKLYIFVFTQNFGNILFFLKETYPSEEVSSIFVLKPNFVFPKKFSGI